MAHPNFTPDDLNPHVHSDTCGKCRKKFQQGERVVSAYIVDRVGPNTANLGQRGIYLFEEYELVHVDCTDTLLKKGLKQ